jgi:predicted RNA-binding Zn-ribbon protein involved in translation (DUF1610 family)
MSKIIKPEDLVGEYEDIVLICCNNCKKETISVVQYKEFNSEDSWQKDFVSHKPWVCSFCNSEEYKPERNKAKRFVCPNCKKENIQVIEPFIIEQREEIRLIGYNTHNVVCMFCDAEFGVGVIVESESQLSDCSLWKQKLYKK